MSGGIGQELGRFWYCNMIWAEGFNHGVQWVYPVETEAKTLQGIVGASQWLWHANMLGQSGSRD